MMTVDELISKAQKNFINLVVIAVCLVVAFKIYSAQNKKLEEIRTNTQTEAQKSAVLKEISQSEGRLKTLKRQIPPQEDAAVSDTVNAIAKNCDVKILSWKPGTKQVLTGYTRSPYSVNIAVNNYHVLGKFISALENHPFVFSIDSMNVVADPNAETRKYKMQVSLEVSIILIKD